MRGIFLMFIVLVTSFILNNLHVKVKGALNPIIYADVPDMLLICISDTNYMSSTKMQVNPEFPIMKSKDLVNYTYDSLADIDAKNLINVKTDYERGAKSFVMVNAQSGNTEEIGKVTCSKN